MRPIKTKRLLILGIFFMCVLVLARSYDLLVKDSSTGTLSAEVIRQTPSLGDVYDGAVAKPGLLAEINKYSANSEAGNHTELSTGIDTQAKAKLKLESALCDFSCMNDTLLHMLDTQSLSEEQLTLVLFDPLPFAELLKNRPSDLATVMSSLRKDELDTELQEAAYAIYSSYSDADRSNLAALLAQGETSDERHAAITLLSPMILRGNVDLEPYAKLLAQEQDPQILAKALNLADKVKGKRNMKLTLTALDRVLEEAKSGNTVAKVLAAKVSLAPSSVEVQEQVLNALNDYSHEMRRAGLYALESALISANVPNVSDSWLVERSVYDGIQNIIGDSEADYELRETAQRILLDYELGS